MRVAVGEPNPVVVVFPAEADGVVAVEVYDALAATTTSHSAVSVGDGVYSFTMTPTMVDTINRLRVTFTGTFSGVARSEREVVDVAGAHYFSLAQAREIGQIKSIFPDSKIVMKRDAVEDQIEFNCGGTSFVERYVEENHRLNEPGFVRLVERFVQNVLYVSVDGDEIEPDYVDGRFLYLPAGTTGNVHVRYTKGYDDWCPMDLRDKAIEATKWELMRANGQGLPTHATSIGTDAGIMRLVVANLRMPFGYPEVDAVVMKYAQLTQWVV